MGGSHAPPSVSDTYRAAIPAARPELEGLPLIVAGRGWHSVAIDVGDRFIAKFREGPETEAALRREASLLAVAALALTPN